MILHRHRRRATALGALLAMLASLAVVTALPASAAERVVTVSPNTNLVSGDSVTVSVTPDGSLSGAFLGVTQCGNATASGTPLASLPTDGSACITDPSTLGTTLAVTGNAGPNNPVGQSYTAGVTYNVPLVLQRTGLGTANAQCISGGIIPCTVAVSPATLAGAYTGPETFQASATIEYIPPASASITQVGGQLAGVTTAARATNTLALSGSNFEASATLTAELCSSPNAASCDVGGLTGAGVTTDGSGAISSSDLTVDASATTGPRVLKLSDSTQSALVPLQVLGTRAVSISPNVGGVGSSVTVTATNFDPQQPAGAIELLDDSLSPAGAPVSAGLVGPTGSFNATVPITNPLTAFISGFEANTGQGAAAAFTFSANGCTLVAGGQCDLVQTVTLTVTPGELIASQAGNQIPMTDVGLNGLEQAVDRSDQRRDGG